MPKKAIFIWNKYRRKTTNKNLCNSANTQRDTILHITNSWWSVQNACCWWRIFLIGKWSINNLNVSRSWCKNAKSDLFITGKCQTAIVQFTYRKVILRVTRPITVLIGRLHLRRYNLISLFTVNKQYNHRFIYSLLDAVPPIHAESSHVATDKVPSM